LKIRSMPRTRAPWFSPAIFVAPSVLICFLPLYCTESHEFHGISLKSWKRQRLIRVGFAHFPVVLSEE
jgi:hypothetical protein